MGDKITIFTDGSSRGNPGPGGWGAIIVEKNKITELGGREDDTTNNRMELTAVIESIKNIKNNSDEIFIYTDSSYVINGITKWIYGWQKNNWRNSLKEDVLNRDLWEKLVEISKGKRIKWNHIPGHAGVPGNERCDVIATNFADSNHIVLCKGDIADYEYDIFNLKGNNIKNNKKTNNKREAYSYVSFVDGKIYIDKTWSECEKRVKGVKGGVKFKKATSSEEEKEIIKDFLR